MSQEKEIIIHNDDQTSFEYVLFILGKVFGIDKTKGREIATQVDALGSAVVFTGSDEQAQEKLAMVDFYNESSSNHLRFTAEDQGAYIAPVEQRPITTGESLTLQFTTYAPDLDQIYNMLGHLVNFGKLGISQKEGQRLAMDLKQGKEILLKDFGSDPRASQKSQVLKDILSSFLGLDGSDPKMEPEEISNVLLSVRSAGYSLLGGKELLSENEMVQHQDIQESSERLDNLAKGKLNKLKR